MDKKTKKLRLYIVPVVHLVAFGGQVEVEATSKTQARKLARDPDLVFIGDGYDWNRCATIKAQLAAGCKVKEIDSE